MWGRGGRKARGIQLILFANDNIQLFSVLVRLRRRRGHFNTSLLPSIPSHLFEPMVITEEGLSNLQRRGYVRMLIELVNIQLLYSTLICLDSITVFTLRLIECDKTWRRQTKVKMKSRMKIEEATKKKKIQRRGGYFYFAIIHCKVCCA